MQYKSIGKKAHVRFVNSETFWRALAVLGRARGSCTNASHEDDCVGGTGLGRRQLMINGPTDAALLAALLQRSIEESSTYYSVEGSSL